MAGFRKSKGFRHAGGLVAGELRQGTQKRGFSQARILTNWAEIVGEDIARIAQPSKISFAKGGLNATLVVLTNGARAPEVQMKLPIIAQRVNAVYGYKAITNVRITQTDAATPGFEENATPFAPAPKPMRNDASDVFDLEELNDSDLRDALDFIGNRVLTRSSTR